MTSLLPPSTTSSGPADLSALDTAPAVDVVAFRKTKEGKDLAAWVKSEYEKAKQARRSKELQWYTNLSMALGNQWVKKTNGNDQLDARLVKPQTPYYRERRTINRARRFTRWELSKFVSQTPSIVAVPGTGTDDDIRAAYAAEQVWEYEVSDKELRKVYTRAAWWTVHTGNGFLKAEWDATARDGEGDIAYSNVTPFNLFIPDLKEPELEEQPFIITAYTKPCAWVQRYFEAELDGEKLTPSVSAANELLDPAYLNITKQSQAEKNAVVVYECWVKPGSCDQLPNGGLVILVEDILLTVDEHRPALRPRPVPLHALHAPRHRRLLRRQPAGRPERAPEGVQPPARTSPRPAGGWRGPSCSPPRAPWCRARSRTSPAS
jgi:hypothetical protein